MSEHVRIPSEAELEWRLLGMIYAMSRAEDRRPDGIMPRDSDARTGLPLDLAPRLVTDRITGQSFMTPGSKILPAGLARGGVSLAADFCMWSGSDDPAGGGPGVPGLAANMISFKWPDGRQLWLSELDRDKWPSHAVNAWREIAFSIRKIFAHWLRLGLVTIPTLYEGQELLGLDNLPRVVRPTWKGIELARQKIPGTRWANAPKSALHGLSASERASQPAYAQASYAKETGGSVSAPLVDSPPVSIAASEPKKEE